MFIKRSTYLKVQIEGAIYHKKYLKLLEQWNKLVTDVNNGLSVRTTPESRFTQKEIRQLITLCHPDRHQNSKVATELTQKLLSIRSKE